MNNVACRRNAVSQVELSRRRPFGSEQRRDRLDRRRNSRQHDVSVTGVSDRGLEHVGHMHGAVVAQQRHPGSERAWDAGRKEAAAGNDVEVEFRETLDRRGCGSNPLSAKHPGPTGARIVKYDRHLTATTVQMRLNHLQREADGYRGIEGIAALLEDTHASSGPEPMRRRHDAEGADDFRPCRKRGFAGARPITQWRVSQRQTIRHARSLVLRICLADSTRTRVAALPVCAGRRHCRCHLAWPSRPPRSRESAENFCIGSVFVRARHYCLPPIPASIGPA